MRTTLDLPDELFRTLKARAALGGVTLRDLVLRLVEAGLRAPTAEAASRRREPPPVIISRSGKPIPAISRAKLHRLEDEADERKHARSARR